MAQPEIHDEDHGHSIAAWTAVATVLVGSALSAVAVVAKSVPLFVIGLVICVLGAVAGKVLSMAGYGQTTVNGADTPDSGKPEVGIS